MKSRFIAFSLTASALMFAQQPQVAQQGPPPRPHMGQRGGPPNPEQGNLRFEQRLAQHLSLSAEQQNKVHTHLADSRVQSQGLHEKMGALNASLDAAIKSGDEGQIDRISQDIASLHQQQTAIHAKTTSKIYQSLTPEQKTKIGDDLGMLGGGGGFGPGFGRGPGPQGRGPGGPDGTGPRGRRPGQQ
jgi:Spy/CpxP family protein refolding chaperone